MARPKKQLKAKEPVRIRTKLISNGNRSIYLDTYKDGKRKYEFLKLYLIPENNPIDRLTNEETMKVAQAIKAQRIIEIANGEAGLTPVNNSKMLLSDWATSYCDEVEASDASVATKHQVKMMKKLLIEFAGDSMRLCDVDEDFCLDFIHYLKNDVYKANCKSKRKLSNSTATLYLLRFRMMINKAYKKKIINKNPLQTVDETIRPDKKMREYLTIDEVKMLIKTDCRSDSIKRAFLFACFCGLRISDIKGLRKRDIRNDNGNYQVALKMQKTKDVLYLPLSEEALKWLPDVENDDCYLFNLPSSAPLSITMKKWAKRAGINKNISFHTSRHTFATMMLTLGVDLYTVSKLLGHSSIQTTQIYAEVIDDTKVEAVNKVKGLF